MSGKRIKSKFGWFLIPIGIILIPGLLLIAGGLNLIRTCLARNSWPSTPGLVLDGKVESYSDETFYIVCEYRYEVDAKTYKSSSITPSGNQFYKNYEEAAARLDTLRDEITVMYNPQQPAEGYLENPFAWDAFIAIGMGLFLTALGILVVMRLAKMPADR